ncbi:MULTISPECIES: Wzz/FepE/Etk N-terminal domain-containing protein [unclassified Aminobacter]|uniref:Wzz/FepE/Etk N-terminal domain-containing protein n=1 Tax=unclassified Aminobacter TaxID=2644704 RepID=UPI0004634D3E|nr:MULTISPECIES: Wzz/FepE/Etk N-terminal domain-containing protein [unclassified Aminobacter]TWH27187.1 Uncharacterized protein involved in exopolysaccharide biosynthesis [Aminobacter sp. J15]
MGTSFGSTWTPYVVGEAAPPFPAHSRQPARETDLRHLVELLRRHARLLILTTAFCIAAAAVIVLLLPPIYTSTTLVLFDPSRKNLLDTAGPASSGSADSARIDSEVEIIRSDEILLAVSAGETSPPIRNTALLLRSPTQSAASCPCRSCSHRAQKKQG